MNEKAAISVIIPVYNVEAYLKQCIDSVIKQTFNDIEIILVNDGSTDESRSICTEYLHKDSRIILIDQTNQGLAAARQTGLKAAHGEYIGFVDSDDWLELNMYEKMYKAAKENHDADIVFCNVFRNESKREQPYFSSGYYNKQQIRETIFPYLLTGFDKTGHDVTIRWCNWLRLYRKKLIDDYHIQFDQRFRRCQDLPFTFECTIHANSYVYLGDDYLYHNRMNYESLSKGYTKNMWQLIKPLVEYLEDVVTKYNEYDFSSQLHSRAALFVFECCENENKPNNIKPVNERINEIKRLMNDEKARKWVLKMSPKGKSRIIKAYRLCFRFKFAWLFYKIAERRFMERKKDYEAKKAVMQ